MAGQNPHGEADTGGSLRALPAADVPDEKARAAATAVADFDRRIERIETKLTLMLSLLGVMVAVMLGGFYAVWAQLVAMSFKLGA
jgi:hypothetical protein